MMILRSFICAMNVSYLTNEANQSYLILWRNWDPVEWTQLKSVNAFLLRTGMFFIHHLQKGTFAKLQNVIVNLTMHFCESNLFEYEKGSSTLSFLALIKDRGQTFIHA